MLIWTNFDSLAITYLMQVACFKKFHSPIEVVLNSLKTQNDLELIFRSQILHNFLIKFLICNLA